MLNDPRLNQHPMLRELMGNVEEDLHLGRSDSAGTDLRKILEYVLKEYYLAYGKSPGQASLNDMLGELTRNKLFDPARHSDNHLMWEDKTFFYSIKNLGNSETHLDPTRPDQGRPSVAKATAAYEDLEIFLPRFFADIPAALTAPRGKSAPAAPAAHPIQVPSRTVSAPVRPAPPPAAARPAPQPRRIFPNDPCPCGSGKKYKNCCGAAAAPLSSEDNKRRQLLEMIQEVADAANNDMMLGITLMYSNDVGVRGGFGSILENDSKYHYTVSQLMYILDKLLEPYLCTARNDPNPDCRAILRITDTERFRQHYLSLILREKPSAILRCAVSIGHPILTPASLNGWAGIRLCRLYSELKI